MPTETVELTAELFEDLAGQSFKVETGDEDAATAELRLEDVRRLRVYDASVRPPFALDLTGPVSEALPQAMYEFRHPSFGVQSIFIVPVGQSAALRRYEAIFN